METPSSASLIDASLKTLIRSVFPAFLRLIGVQAGSEQVRLGDVSVNLPEFRADQLFMIGEEDDASRWALHIEYQLEPDERMCRGWYHKNAALNAQLKRPVVLVAVYLTRGDRSRFPSSYRIEAGGLSNEYRFHAVHLWEYAERIRRGDLPELAPLLLLCEDRPDPETVLEEKQLIHGLSAPPEMKSHLLAVAYTVGLRYFSRGVLDALFREEREMIEADSWIRDWVLEGEARGRAEGCEKPPYACCAPVSASCLLLKWTR